MDWFTNPDLGQAIIDLLIVIRLIFFPANKVGKIR